jgi:hypothetical protein
MTKLETIKDLETSLIQELKDNDLKSCRHLLEQYFKDNNGDWKNYINYTEVCYNRQLVVRNDLFDILVISWKKDQKSKIHDHPDKGCLMIVMQGEIHENLFVNKDNNVIKINENKLKIGDIGYKERNHILHDIAGMENSVSLHIYAPPFYCPKYFSF